MATRSSSRVGVSIRRFCGSPSFSRVQIVKSVHSKGIAIDHMTLMQSMDAEAAFPSTCVLVGGFAVLYKVANIMPEASRS